MTDPQIACITAAALRVFNLNSATENIFFNARKTEKLLTITTTFSDKRLWYRCERSDVGVTEFRTGLDWTGPSRPRRDIAVWMKRASTRQ